MTQAEPKSLLLNKSLPIGCTLTDLRLLDFDDMLALILIAEGNRQVEVARSLGITPPALSHRIRKWREIFKSELMEKVNVDGKLKVILTPFGHDIADRVKSVVVAMAS